MKKTYKKLLSFLTVVCCLAGSLGTVHASGSGEVPRVVFENESDGSAALYVGKEVVDAEGRTIDPGSSVNFTFTLTLSSGGVTSDQRQTYVLCDLNGKEFTREELKELFGQDVAANSFYTQNGRFSLKAGQMARFSGISVGTDYEIRELPAAGYTQVEPAGGAAKVGSKENKNETVVFKNRTDTGGGGEAKLEISKTISFPDGYEVPETPDFRFQLLLSKAPAAGLPYTVKDSRTNEAKRTSVTEEDGVFTLKGGETAVFEGKDANGVAYIPDQTDYEVSEIDLPPGWQASDAGPLKGAVNGATYLNFHNSEAAFAVTKRMEDFSTPDVEFRFELKKVDGVLWPGAEYYYYDRNKNLIVQQDGSKTHTTEPDGTFVLKPGETAVFVKIPQGTVYSVNEVGNPEYIQTQPLKTEGYTDLKVESSVRTLPFVNKKAEYKSLLTVTKKVVNKKGDASETAGEDVFRFILRKLDNSGSAAVMADEVYSVQVGSSTNTYRTGTDGAFTLKANETARFENLLPGTYQVEETRLDGLPGYQFDSVTVINSDTLSGTQSQSGSVTVLGGASASLSAASVDLNGESASGGASAQTGSDDGYDITDSDSSEAGTTIPPAESKAEGTLGTSGLIGFVFTNTYWSEKADLQIVKTSPSGDALEGAEFRLLKAETDTEGRETTVLAGTGISDADGNISFDVPLTEGTWYIEETKVPVGYQVMSSRLKIVIGRDANGLPAAPVVTIENDTGTSTLENGKDFVDGSPAKYAFTEGDQTRDQLTLTIKNEYLYSLPKTGGTGTLPYTLAGITLLIAAAFLYIRRRRLERP